MFPVEPDGLPVIDGPHGAKIVAHGNADSVNRTVFTLMSHLCIMTLGCVFGARMKYLSRKSVKDISFINILVLALYGFSTSFVLGAAILQDGFNVNSPATCSAAVYCCLVFYFLSKAAVQLFLVERAHAIRAHKLTRLRDPVWAIFGLIMMLGFGTIIVCALIWPNAEMSPVDHVCRIGVPLPITMPLLVWDIMVNICLTGIFIWLLRPIGSKRLPLRGAIMVHRRISLSSVDRPVLGREDIHLSGTKSSIASDPRYSSSGIEISGPKEMARRQAMNIRHFQWINRLIMRSVLGCLGVILPTIANLGLLYHSNGREPGWVCLTFCSLDVAWTVIVLHWLTLGTPNAEGEIPKSALGNL